MKSKNGKVPYLIHSFSVGKRRAANGKEKKITPEIIRELCSTFDSSMRPAMVAGHISDDPKFARNDGMPKFGTIKGVKSDKDFNNLYLLVEATAAGDDLIQKGYFDNFSIGIYPPNHPCNPKPGKHVVRHLAMLGNSPPSIKDLDPALRLLPFDFSEMLPESDNDLEVYGESLMLYRSGGKHRNKIKRDFSIHVPKADSGRLRCTQGNKECGGKCIPNGQKCHVGESSTVGAMLPLTARIPQISVDKAKVAIERRFGMGRTDVRTERNQSSERGPAREFFKRDKEEKSFNDRLTKGAFDTLKVAGVIGAGFLGQYLVKKYAPDSTSAKIATEAIVRIAAGQTFVSPDADVNTRVLNIAETMVPFLIEKGAEAGGVDSTVTKSSATLVSSVVFGKDGVFPTSYDSMQRKLMAESVKIGEYAGQHGSIRSREKSRDDRTSELQTRISNLENKYDATVTGISELRSEVTSDVANMRSAHNAANARVARANEELTTSIQNMADREQISRDAMAQLIDLHKSYGDLTEEQRDASMADFVRKLLEIQQRYYANESFAEGTPGEDSLEFTGAQKAMIKAPLLYLLAFNKDNSDNYSEESIMSTSAVDLLQQLVNIANESVDGYAEEEEEETQKMPMKSGKMDKMKKKKKMEMEMEDEDDEDENEDEEDNDDESMMMMKKKMNKMKNREYQQYAETLYGNEGPLTIGIIDPTSLLNIFQTLDGNEDLHFSEDTGGSALEDFMGMMRTLGETVGAGLPKSVNYSMLDFSEMNDDGTVDFSEDDLQSAIEIYAEDCQLPTDHPSVIAHAKAIALMAAKPGMTYFSAISQVAGDD